MKIIISPDSFKESMSSIEVAQAIKEGFQCHLPLAEYSVFPMADGGEGMLETLTQSYESEFQQLTLPHPHLAVEDNIEASYGYIEEKKLLIIESAQAVGLDIVPMNLRNPMQTTTYGLGMLMRHAYEHYIQNGRADSMLIGIGGTATVDGGLGMLEALGAKCLDTHGNVVPRGGQGLSLVQSIVMDDFIDMGSCDIIVASDVQNPLYGVEGAARVFGPQKGASEDIVEELERGMQHFASMVAEHFALEEAQVNAPCGGAAGGLGMSLPIFCKARIQSGIDIITDLTGLESALEDADLVITGEGKVDGQSIQGKVVFGVAQVAKRYGVPVCIIAGALDRGYETLYAHGVDAMFSVTAISADWERIKNDSRENLVSLSRSVAAMMKFNVRDCS